MFNSLQLVHQSEVAYNNKQFKKACSNNKNKLNLKLKENIIQHKYRKELKKKLKKYRLRHDGQEDPEVLDVSKILVSSLKIKSPNHREKELECTFENELNPKNYLFKMGRHKRTLCKVEPDKSDIVNNVTSTCEEKSKKVIRVPNSNSEIVTKNYTQNVSTKEIKKQTNAFQLLMESRHKSIGGNSPGKERIVDEYDSQEEIEKRNAKVKRTLLLQKMAEAKGSVQNKVIEEHQEKIIKKKMEKRAERLKGLILNIEPKPGYQKNRSDSKEEVYMKEDQLRTCNDRILKKRNVHLVDLFQETEETLIKSPQSKYVSRKEDKEFLKKLSPSLKKRENMLSYFKKIERDKDIESEDAVEVDDVLFKIKLRTNLKNKAKKKKLSMNKDTTSVINNLNIVDQSENSNNISHDVSATIENVTILKSKNIKTQKESPVNLDNQQKNSQSIVSNKEFSEVNLSRPKRNIKRPVKYIDEAFISSSDEELHIFTPKRKKPNVSQIDSCSKVNNEETTPRKSTESNKELELVNNNRSKKNLIAASCHKKPTKLAPIFNAKPPLDAVAIEAKQRFLNSGVPDKLKKISEKQNNKYVMTNSFETVVHVQQCEPLATKSCVVDYNINELDDDSLFQVESKNLFEKLLSLGTLYNKFSFINQELTENELHNILHDVKKSYPKFPVYRTYRLLKDKSRGQCRANSFLDHDNSIEVINNIMDLINESPERLNWIDKYKPMSSKEIIGNFEITKELKKWLVSWTENDVKSKKYSRSDSDSSDFYHSDTDSKDAMKITNNLLILSGPVGSGKTSIVYAVAAELSIKVLEVNASSKRTGKIMLQDLHEATQSHKVNRSKSSSSQDSSQKLQEVIQMEVLTKPKKRGRPKKSVTKSLKNLESIPSNEGFTQSQANQDSTQTCMSLILIDDADIVFEQDDGFCSAIVQLVQCSKRPVILITSLTTCPHLQRFVNIARILKTQPLLPEMLGVWLDIMCLVENNRWCPGIGAQLLSSFQGDIRRTINYLQFYFPKEKVTIDSTATQSIQIKINVEDESSSMSWLDREAIEEKSVNNNSNLKLVSNYAQDFLNDKNSLLCFKYPMKLFNVWWNTLKLLKKPLDNLDEEETYSKPTKKNQKLQTISNALDTISFADCFRKTNSVTDITDSPWRNLEKDSVSEQENLDNYNKCDITADEIAHELIKGSIVNSQKLLDVKHDNNLELPGFNAKRARDKVISRHNNLTEYLNAAASLDRRALALDYWSSCRSICRIEKTKTDTSLKRNNRYCHYLKSLNILCNNDSLDNLSRSLSLRKED